MDLVECILEKIRQISFRSRFYSQSSILLCYLVPRPLLSLILMSKSKKTLEISLDLTSSFKTSLDARVEKKTSGAHTRFVLWTVIFLFVQTFYTADDS